MLGFPLIKRHRIASVNITDIELVSHVILRPQFLLHPKSVLLTQIR